MITTLRGEVPVEALAPGDRVVTRDHGLQSLRAVARRTIGYGQLGAVPHLQPLLVTIGALGAGLPERDMLVSPNLRLLVTGGPVPEALVAAKKLMDNRTVRPCTVLGVTYVHLAFDRHEVVLANGVWVEAFQPGDLSRGAAGNAQRLELRELFAGAEMEERANRALPVG